MDIEIRYFEDCPNWQDAGENLARILEELGMEANVTYRLVDTIDEAERFDFKGSPTILIEGEDPWDRADAPVGLSCRVYRTKSGFAGSPSDDQLRQALQAAR